MQQTVNCTLSDSLQRKFSTEYPDERIRKNFFRQVDYNRHWKSVLAMIASPEPCDAFFGWLLTRFVVSPEDIHGKFFLKSRSCTRSQRCRATEDLHLDLEKLFLLTSCIQPNSNQASRQIQCCWFLARFAVPERSRSFDVPAKCIHHVPQLIR